MQGKHVLSVVESVPNKRGPVELGLLATGREWIRGGGSYTIGFLDHPVPWYRAMLDDAGIETFVVTSAGWDREIVDRARRLRPALVHLHFGRHTAAGPLRRLGARVIRTEHSHRVPRRAEALRRIERWRRQRPLDHFIAVSPTVAAQTRRDFLVPASRITMVPNGVDTELFRPRPEQRSDLRARWFDFPDDTVVTTCAAYFTARKRQHLLLEALALVLPTHPQARLVLAGDGELRGELLALRHRLGLTQQARILYGDNNIPEIYAASDIAALVSWGEGLPGAALEGMATGLPLLATPTPGLRDAYVDDQGGVSAATETAEGIATAWRRLLDDRFRAEQGRLARTWVEQQFSLEAHAAGTVAVYDRVLGHPSSPADSASHAHPTAG